MNNLKVSLSPVGLVISVVATVLLFLVFGVWFNNGMTVDYVGLWNILVLGFALGAFYDIAVANKNVTVSLIISGLLGLIIAVYTLFNSEFVQSDRYYNMLKVETISMEKLEIKAEDTRTSTKDIALKAANKVLGVEYNGVMISSQYNVNSNYAFIQEINGKLTWVFPLDYRGFFKWLKQDSIPGYILVSATNDTAKAKLVLDYEIKYSRNAWFGKQIERKMWFISGGKRVMSHLELDNTGKPFYVGSVMKPTIGFNAHDVESVIVLDAQTGSYEEISPSEVKSEKYNWIDRILPEDETLERINWYGEYEQGWWNAAGMPGENIKEATSYNNAELWFTKFKNGNYWFTGVTSNTSDDESLVNGIIVDTLTGRAMSFPMPGVTDEKGAIQQADSSLGADGIKWDAVLPQPQFIKGEFYWITTIKSSNNLFQKVVAVKGDETNKVWTAKTVESLIQKIENGFETTNDNETIKIKKSTYLKILSKVKELNELVAELEGE